MVRHYLLLSLKVLRRRPFFTFISLFGISFTLLVLMVATAILDNMFGPGAPESRLDRMLGVRFVGMYNEGNGLLGTSAGYGLFDRYARDLPGVEALTIFSWDRTVAYTSGGKIESDLKWTDAAFWRVFDFTFVEGRPFTAADEAGGRLVAVVNRTTRSRFFGGDAAVGRALEIDRRQFTVVGVVDDVPRLREAPYAEIWVPHTAQRSSAYRTEMAGGFQAIALARDRASMPLVREAFDARIESATISLPGGTFTRVVAPFETKAENFARYSPFGNLNDPRSQTWRMALFIVTLAGLFLLLPTVNLVNINISRIMERASEIGVRKAFGASSNALVTQFVVENVMLTAAGGLIGFVLSVLFIRALDASGVIPYSQFVVNLRVFGYGLVIAVVFGVVSGVYPAWRMSRLHPVSALRGAASR